MQIPIQHTDVITKQLREITAENSDIYRFTRLIMHSPEISGDDKHTIIALQRKFVLARIEEIAAGRNLGPVSSPIHNPATLATLNEITDALMLALTKPKGNA